MSPRSVFAGLLASLFSFSAVQAAAPLAPFPLQKFASKVDPFAAGSWEKVPALTREVSEISFSGKAQVQYDAEALYIRSEVKDTDLLFAPAEAVSETTSELYKYDCFEFWIGRQHFAISAAGEGTVVFDYTKGRLVTDAKVQMTRSAEGYGFIARIPWKSLGFEPSPLKFLQLSLWFTDFRKDVKKPQQYAIPAQAEWDRVAGYGAAFLNTDIPLSKCASFLEPLFFPVVETGAFKQRNRLFLRENPVYGPLTVHGKVDGHDPFTAKLGEHPLCLELPLAKQAGIEAVALSAEFPGGKVFGPVTVEYFANSDKALREYRSELKLPADFNEFWDQRVAELAKEPMAAEMRKLDVPANNPADLWEVTLRGWKGVKFVAYLSIPKAPGKYPLILSPYPAVPVNVENITLSGNSVNLAVDPRGFGASEKFSPRPKQLYVADCDKPEDFYVLANVLDIMRAIDFALTQEKVDPARIFIGGGSRGGYITMAVAAADKRITSASASVPCYADVDMMGRLGHASAAHEAFVAYHGGTPERQEKMKRIWPYFDSVNLATRIQCPIVIEAGMMDTICAAPGIVDAYNHIPATTEKYLLINPEQGHTGTEPGGAIKALLRARTPVAEASATPAASPR